MPDYRFSDVIASNEDAQFSVLVAQAYARRERPACLCTPYGLPMYIAKMSSGEHVLKRMPGTGPEHALDCPAYEAPEDAAAKVGGAVREDPDTGVTTLRLDFALTQRPGRAGVGPAGLAGDTVRATPSRLSLRGLLLYLWSEAGLNRWHPGFAHRRNWGVVRHHLLQAADAKRVASGVLLDRLYIPEPFRAEDRVAIAERRLARWTAALSTPGTSLGLLLIIAELKELVPTRFGAKAMLKHMPDCPVHLDAATYSRAVVRFRDQLAMWGTSEGLHLVLVGTMSVQRSGLPVMQDLSAVLATEAWLPVLDEGHRRQLEGWVADGRSFVAPCYPQA